MSSRNPRPVGPNGWSAPATAGWTRGRARAVLTSLRAVMPVDAAFCTADPRRCCSPASTPKRRWTPPRPAVSGQRVRRQRRQPVRLARDLPHVTSHGWTMRPGTTGSPVPATATSCVPWAWATSCVRPWSWTGGAGVTCVCTGRSPVGFSFRRSPRSADLARIWRRVCGRHYSSRIRKTAVAGAPGVVLLGEDLSVVACTAQARASDGPDRGADVRAGASLGGL